ncbi:MAG TPA: class II aldolase/adducin family protein [Candidatus Limnocylindria bacterium]|jgi:ribulose-5-phosphate 4-epimerase/fuculose-1-phosphate aldolase|nr:class II aldolase/adducin family protein [Candidatus Limnocylindria bacterium]
MTAAQTAFPSTHYPSLIARAVRILNDKGIMDMNGHVSARDEDAPGTMWINSRKASRSTLTFADVVPVDLAGGRRIGEGDEPPSEFHIHRAVMRARPDVGAVVHSHPEFIVTLSIAGHKLVAVSGIGSFLPEDVPVFDDANLINTALRGEAIAAALGDAPILVLRGHGAVVVGATVEEAVARYVCAEENARMQYRASLLGTPHVLRGEELEIVRRETWTATITKKHWHYHEESARRSGAFEGVEG